jgi:hypothetical protein
MDGRMASATRIPTVTRAEAARRAMFAEYASVAGQASQAGKGHRLTTADRKRRKWRRQMREQLLKDGAVLIDTLQAR